MRFSIAKKSIIRWSIGVAAVLVFFLVLVFGISKYYEPILGDRLKKAVFEGTNGLYTIKFARINTDVITGNAVIKELEIIPSKRRYRELIALKKAPDNVYHIKLQKLSIKGFHPYNFFKNRKLHIREISMEQPEILMVSRPLGFYKEKQHQPKKSPFEDIKKYLSEIFVENVWLNDTHIIYKNESENRPATRIEHLNIQLKNWLLNATTERDSSRFYYFEDAVFNLPMYQINSKDSLYHTQLENITVLLKEKELNIGELNSRPTLPVSEFQRKAGFKKVHITSSLSGIEIRGFDLIAFLKTKIFHADELRTQSGSIILLNGKGIVQKLKERPEVVPQMLLQHFPSPFDLQKANFKALQISYEEYNFASNKTGKVTFNNTDLEVKNATNMPNIYQKNQWFTANIHTTLMGQTALDISTKMDYLSADGAFTMQGKVGQINGRAFNQITVPLGLLMFKSLLVNEMKFDLIGNNSHVDGSMDFRYNNLSIALLKKDEESGLLQRKGLMSLMANNLVLENSNPDEQGNLTIAPIHFDREITFSFPKYIWRALLTGIKYSIGLTPQKESMMKQKIEEFKVIKEKFEAYREHRAAQKQQKIKRQMLQK